MRQSLVRGFHLNAMEVTTASSAQGDDKYAAPSGNQKCAETSVRHLIVSGIWLFLLMNIPTMKIFLQKFLQAKRPILVFLTCQLGFLIKKIGGGGWCLAGSIMMLTMHF
ncbi:hypothetical protein Pyn_37644 [Prunus yedoensis var. nudiflora]|uniref:Uncharacterized protein n=1 Tax=Prunus yedoensis var. nudiflora TaxID=2094558 RepID=A0A314ZIH8_PRUYE|nr:hypothetical protein Pyn_00705 [Prunus yedoensis var. nudiflora]PQQ18460.1 hypothetical protein Pyn_37644 [Prunus yedoensis var. nudiflora]